MANEISDQGTVRYIRCPSCGTPNPGTAKMCSQCGKPMAAGAAAPPSRPAAQPGGQVVCSKCRKPLPAGSRFCGFCGAPLRAPAPAAPRPPERPGSAPTQAMPQPSAQKPAPPPPAAKPPAKPAPPPPSAKPPAAAPPPKPVHVPPAPPAAAPSAPPPAPRPAPPPVSPTEGTQLFTGLHVPEIEASFTEVKPDGSTGKTTQVTKEITIGRENCEVAYKSDALLSPRHASLLVRENKLLLKDLKSQNGTFTKQRQDSELQPSDVFLIGRELFRFTTQSMDEGSPEGTQVMRGAPKLQKGPVTAKLERIQLSGDVVEVFNLEKPETTLGRSKGDLIFKNDPYMSGTHARIVAQPGRFILQDMNSRNGVYRRIRAEAELQDGDEFFLGEQLFRVSIKHT